MTLFSQDINVRHFSVNMSPINDIGGESPNFTDIVKEFTALEGQYIIVLKKIQKILADPIQTWYQQQQQKMDKLDQAITYDLSRRLSDQSKGKISHLSYQRHSVTNGYSKENGESQNAGLQVEMNEHKDNTNEITNEKMHYHTNINENNVNTSSEHYKQLSTSDDNDKYMNVRKQAL